MLSIFMILLANAKLPSARRDWKLGSHLAVLVPDEKLDRFGLQNFLSYQNELGFYLRPVPPPGALSNSIEISAKL